MRCPKRVLGRIGYSPNALLQEPRRAQRLVGALAQLGLLVAHLGALVVARALELEPDALRRHLGDAHLGGARGLQHAAAPASRSAAGGTQTETVAGAVRSPVEWLKTGRRTATCSFGTTIRRPSPGSM